MQTNGCFQTKALSHALKASYEYDVIAVTIFTYDTQVYMSAPIQCSLHVQGAGSDLFTKCSLLNIDCAILKAQ